VLAPICLVRADRRFSAAPESAPYVRPPEADSPVRCVRADGQTFLIVDMRTPWTAPMHAYTWQRAYDKIRTVDSELSGTCKIHGRRVHPTAQIGGTVPGSLRGTSYSPSLAWLERTCISLGHLGR
jgi:hypothetical protein